MSTGAMSAGKGYTVLCDGVPIPNVVAFDAEGGWVEAQCLHGGKPHPHPRRRNEACTRTLHGRIEVVIPEGIGGQ